MSIYNNSTKQLRITRLKPTHYVEYRANLHTSEERNLRMWNNNSGGIRQKIPVPVLLGNFLLSVLSLTLLSLLHMTISFFLEGDNAASTSSSSSIDDKDDDDDDPTAFDNPSSLISILIFFASCCSFSSCSLSSPSWMHNLFPTVSTFSHSPSSSTVSKFSCKTISNSYLHGQKICIGEKVNLKILQFIMKGKTQFSKA